jgi:ATP-binding cassette subfamily E protein 1
MFKQDSNRLAIVDHDKCNPIKCDLECFMKCPPNQLGKKCIILGDVEDLGKKAIISNSLCIGCNACARACRFSAISIVNLPHQLTSEKLLVSYGENSFRVYMHPHIKKGHCVGMIGSNGLGKTTILKILSGKLKIDIEAKKKLLGRSEIYSYLKNDKLVISYKPQDINTAFKKEIMVGTLFENISEKLLINMGLEKLADRTVEQLSGGELQRLLIAVTCSKKADSYLFDEPTAFLDIKQRVLAGILIQETIKESYCVLIEHDLCIFDYIASYVMCLYGEKGCYSVVSSLSNTFNGINNYIEGYLPTENVKFRSKPIKFEYKTMEGEVGEKVDFRYDG